MTESFQAPGWTRCAVALIGEVEGKLYTRLKSVTIPV
jgi:hypothetical protein